MSPHSAAQEHGAAEEHGAEADRRDGARNPWLRALDRVGLGFDS